MKDRGEKKEPANRPNRPNRPGRKPDPRLADVPASLRDNMEVID
jgi:hypothetical protein